jgi:hypothetical protein
MMKRSKSQAGQALLEFAIVTISLTFLFAGAFTIGAMLNKALQVSNVTRSAAVLMVSSVTNPTAPLNMALASNQQILVSEASGLGMNVAGSFAPNPTGTAAIFLSKIVLVGANECASAGIAANTSGAPYTTSNCPNFNSYVFEYYVAIGNNSRWASFFGTPPSGTVLDDGTISAANIAKDTSLQVPAATMTSVITLSQSQYTLVAETYADISGVAIFSIYKPPIIYYRTVT